MAVLTLIGFGLFFVAFFALAIGGMVFWIFMLIDVARLPDWQFRAAGTEKVTWVLVVALAGWIGALVWRLAKRDDVHGAAQGAPPVPPGWYPDPAGIVRWWDGRQWTLQHTGPPGPPQGPVPPGP